MPTSDRSRLPLLQLAWPIFVENLLRTALMSVDTLMLSRYSAKAVAAMSVVNQFAFFLQLLYMMVSTGASILITQSLGAGKKREAGLYGVASLALILGASLVISVAFVLCTPLLLGLYRLEPEVALYARQFLTIYGGLSFLIALNIGQASILRAWGYARDPMMVNISSLLFIVCGNALCLFGFFGFPVLGVAGVAGTTMLAYALACTSSFLLIRRRVELELPLREVLQIPRRLYRSMLAIGVPTAGENLSYNLSQIAILAMLSKVGTDALATYGILMSVLRYVFMPGVSIGMAAQIKVGYLVGAGRPQEAVRAVYRYFAIAFAISLGAVLLVQAFHRPILALFSADAGVLALAASVLLVSLVLEPGRNFNTVIIPALKGAGDVRFPVQVGIVSMWGIGVGGAWLLGVHSGHGLVGVWIAMTADEWLRGLAMLLRWRSGAWRKMALVSAADEVAALSPVEIGDGL